MSNNLTPVQVCERLIAPIEVLSEMSGFGKKYGYAWRRPAKTRDAGDMPPRVNRTLLAHSKKMGLGLTAEHLIRGATQAEIDEILAARDPSRADVAA